MDNLATKSPSCYDGSVDVSSDQQTFNTNHKYIHLDLLLLHSWEYRVINTKLLIIWGNQYLQYRKIVSILHCARNQYHKMIKTSNLIVHNLDFLSLQLLHHLEVYT